jgi:hypothetical protein
MPMNQLERLLRTDPRDPGCDDTRHLLHVYADALLERRHPEWRFPGVAIHLEQCRPCADELHGLLAATMVR